MGYDLYFVNDTTREIVTCKKTSTKGMEQGPELLAYLSACVGHTFRILDDSSGFVEEELLSDTPTYTVRALAPHA